MIPYGRQQIDESDIDAVVAVLRSDWLTQGPAIEAFECAVAQRCDARYAVAVSNATAALHLACLAAGLGLDDWLWTSPNTFVASANCARYCGAKVDFVDIDPVTWNMDVAHLAAKLAHAEKLNRLPKILVPVAFSGQSCDMAAIRSLADVYGVLIIEDASHAIGATYQGRPVGCGDYADMTVFSFHPVKIITSGEGGMLLTNSAELQQRLYRLRSHGISRDPALMSEPSHGPWYYQQLELGFNYSGGAWTFPVVKAGWLSSTAPAVGCEIRFVAARITPVFAWSSGGGRVCLAFVCGALAAGQDKALSSRGF